MNEDSIDDDTEQLSASTLAALKEFYEEREKNSDRNLADENWELSQFWYTEKTSTILAEECYRLVADLGGGKIACVSCPTVFKTLRDLIECRRTSNGDGAEPKIETFLFEFDRRFEELYGDQFVFYDYNRPTEGFRRDFRKFFDVLIVDPPFLSDECLTKIAETIKFLTKFIDSPLILCTGAVMETLSRRLLGVVPCKFSPKHVRKLGNEFKCYINYRDNEFLNNSSDNE